MKKRLRGKMGSIYPNDQSQLTMCGALIVAWKPAKEEENY